jgi:hypothetical protein
MSTYTLYIMGDDSLIPVDARDLDTDTLHALRDEAGSAGDTEAVATIDAVLAGRE